MKPFKPQAVVSLLLFCLSGPVTGGELGTSPHDLVFRKPASTWDEGIPLGNGTVGVLVWKKDGRLRLSIDRADLWDLRPMNGLDTKAWTFAWVREQWTKDDYGFVQDKFDRPYEERPAPSKIPAGALEFDLKGFGEEVSVRLSIEDAVCLVTWPDGKTLETFVDPTKPVGWFKFKGAPPNFRPILAAPPYQAAKNLGPSDSVTGQDLVQLGYEQGRVEEAPGLIVFRQEGWGGFYYEIAAAWASRETGEIVGAWSVSSKFSDDLAEPGAEARTREEMKRGFDTASREHAAWWKDFWSHSSIRLPDPVLEKQWYLEQYKFGAAARRGAPPISLQSVWTADNGKLPPWKGDFHHDLNTQLSYWPCYSANHLEEGLGFLDWLWALRPVFMRYTKEYFRTSGLNVPGVTTLAGEPMGGWAQYSLSPTVSAWLAQNFYLHWRFSMDRTFLAERAFPWVRDVAIHLDEISERDEKGLRKLPLSSSPEIFDNSREAWFAQTTNYDLALIRWTLRTAAELADELEMGEEARKWRAVLAEWPDFAIDPDSGLMFAPGFPYRESHRHFSHLMAFHPLGLIDGSHGEREQAIIRNTLATLDRVGPDWWCGYSYAWLGSLKARALDGDGAAAALRTFATCFCLRNSFHVNGDQSGTGRSKLTYRPFTLEGNFAFAAGIQEMLLQSHAGAIRVFPAVPKVWKETSFRNLRAQGAFLVSAEMSGGDVREVRVLSEKGGRLRLFNPFHGRLRINGEALKLPRDMIEIDTKPGQIITILGDMAKNPLPR